MKGGENMKALKIETDGSRELVDITGATVEEQNDCIYDILGNFFDTVMLAHNAMMLVDDEGLLKGLPINPAAMMISGYPMIVGTALIVGLEDTPDGKTFTDVPERFRKLA